MAGLGCYVEKVHTEVIYSKMAHVGFELKPSVPKSLRYNHNTTPDTLKSVVQFVYNLFLVDIKIVISYRYMLDVSVNGRIW